MKYPTILGRCGFLAILSRAAMAATLASCASPPLKLYTMAVGAPFQTGIAQTSTAQTSTDQTSTDQTSTAISRDPIVVEIRRVDIPDYLDSQDILVRSGNMLVRSQQGRLASRLSVEATGLLARWLAAAHPDALVTDQLQAQAPTYRLVVNISVLDVTSDGAGKLAADWQILARDQAQPERRGRTQIRLTGSVATDQDVVILERRLLDSLAEKIGASLFAGA